MYRFTRASLRSGALLLASLVLAAMADAGTLFVDGCAQGPGNGSAANPFSSLSAAVAAAAPGDVIVLQNGVYPETPVVGKDVTIISAGGSALVGAGYFVGTQEVCVPVCGVGMNPSGSPGNPCGTGSCAQVHAKIYYPSLTPSGSAVACGGPFPAVVFSHGHRNASWALSAWSSPGATHDDYLQADGLLEPLARAGFIGISVDTSWGTFSGQDKGVILLAAIAYLRDQHLSSGALLGGAVDLNRVALAGHSMGGTAAAWAASRFDDSLVSPLPPGSVDIAAMVLIAPGFGVVEGFQFQGQFPEDIPALVFIGSNEHPFQVADTPVDLYSTLDAPKHLVVIEGANHFGFSDGISLDPADGKDNPSEVGGLTGPAAEALQQLTASKYIGAFLSAYLCGETGQLSHLTQVGAGTCSPSSILSAGAPQAQFGELQSAGVGVTVCSCTGS